jgi:hypothetical protein
MNLGAFGRLTMKEGVLSDGTIVPPGWTVAVVSRTVHRDPSVYPNPDTFDPFRFSKLRMEADSDVKYGFTTLDKDYILFGVGRHACPGRFLCVNLPSYYPREIILSVYPLNVQCLNGAQDRIGDYFAQLGYLLTGWSEGKAKEYDDPGSNDAPSQGGVGVHEAVGITGIRGTQ